MGCSLKTEIHVVTWGSAHYIISMLKSYCACHDCVVKELKILIYPV